MKKPFKVLVADDHQLICEGVKKILEKSPDFSYQGKANNGTELQELIKTKRADIVLLDIRMYYPTTLHSFISQLKKEELKIVIFSSYFSPQLLEELLFKNDVDGYIIKEGLNHQLLTALREIAEGKKYYSHTISPIIIEILNSRKILEKLTKREQEILSLLLFSKEDIAKKLNITPHTVKRHLYKIKKKLQIKGNDEMLKFALKSHLIKTPLPFSL